ncbi:hypothetical protein EDB19DRAFT_1912073 [Suillus lakei]|nr:hypothetical protein EDB19DRAFT_1912073 [Suillus lakei]
MTRPRSPINVAILRKDDYRPPVVHRQKTLQVKELCQRLGHGRGPFHQKKPGTLSVTTASGGSSSAPEVGSAVAATAPSKPIGFDENTAAALLLGIEDSTDEGFFHNLIESEAGGLDDEHGQSGDEEGEKLGPTALTKETYLICDVESESDGVEENEEPKTDEDDVIDIPLHVPVNGVLDTLMVRSDISWDTFHHKITNAMETSLENLSISYNFSTNAKADPPCKLDSAYNLFQLLEDASKELSGAAGKSRKRKFTVDIVNIQLEVSKGESKKGTLTGGNTKKGKADDKDSDGGGKPADAVDWDNNTDVAKLPPLKIVVGLQMKYACAQHQGCCFILKNGDHCKLPLSDISHWAFMIAWVLHLFSE